MLQLGERGAGWEFTSPSGSLCAPHKGLRRDEELATWPEKLLCPVGAGQDHKEAHRALGIRESSALLGMWVSPRGGMSAPAVLSSIERAFRSLQRQERRRQATVTPFRTEDVPSGERRRTPDSPSQRSSKAVLSSAGPHSLFPSVLANSVSLQPVLPGDTVHSRRSTDSVKDLLCPRAVSLLGGGGHPYPRSKTRTVKRDPASCSSPASRSVVLVEKLKGFNADKG